MNITISKEDQSILVAVQDNGIGRKAAEKINQNSIIKRKSLSSDIMKKRLALNKYKNENITNLKIIDLNQEANGKIGTLVKLSILLK